MFGVGSVVLGYYQLTATVVEAAVSMFVHNIMLVLFLKTAKFVNIVHSSDESDVGTEPWTQRIVLSFTMEYFKAELALFR